MKEKYVFIIDQKILNELPCIFEVLSKNIKYIVDMDKVLEDKYCDIDVTTLNNLELDDVDAIVFFDTNVLNKYKKYILSEYDYDESKIYEGQDFFNMLISSIKEVALYNVGRYTKDFEFLFPNIKVKYYLDNNKARYKKLNEFDKDCLLIICDRKSENLTNLLCENGLEYQKDYLWFEDMGALINDLKYIGFHAYENYGYVHNYDMLKRIIYTDSKETYICTFPFDFLVVYNPGNVHCCCGNWGNNVLGNLFTSSLEEIWESYAINLRRLAIVNKTYAFCSEKNCPGFKRTNKDTTTRYDDLKITPYPKTLQTSIDDSCNLYCRSCRTGQYRLTPEELERAYVLKDKILSTKWYDDVCLEVAGSGEVFYSKIYQDIIFNRNDSVKKIRVFNNGTLMSSKFVDRLCEKYEDITILISIDAATKKTYEYLRRGGNFDYLMKNLEYLSKKKKESKNIKKVYLNFVIQRHNYLEIPEFVQLVKRLGFEVSNFTRIINWGTYSDEEFKYISMYDEKGKPNDELRKVINTIDKKDFEYIYGLYD